MWDYDIEWFDAGQNPEQMPLWWVSAWGRLTPSHSDSWLQCLYFVVKKFTVAPAAALRPEPSRIGFRTSTDDQFLRPPLTDVFSFLQPLGWWAFEKLVSSLLNILCSFDLVITYCCIGSLQLNKPISWTEHSNYS